MTARTKSDLSARLRPCRSDLRRLRDLVGDLLDSVLVHGEIATRTDTGTTPPATLPEIGIFGALSAQASPSGATTGAVKTSLVRMITASSQNGAWTGTSHPLGGLDILRLEGANNFAQAFGHESRIENASTGTLTETAFYKAVMDVNAGSVGTISGLDFPDLSTLAAAASRQSILVRDPDATAVLGGGYSMGNRSILTETHTLSLTDSGKIMPVAAGTPATITCPSSMPAGRVFTLVQADGNQISIAAGAGAAVVNASSHSKSRALGAVITLHTSSPGVFILSGDTGT